MNTLNHLTETTERRVVRLLRSAGLQSMWGELQQGSWGVVIGSALHTVSSTDDCDRIPDPRDVDYAVIPAHAEGGWDNEAAVVVEHITMREALKRIAKAKDVM